MLDLPGAAAAEEVLPPEKVSEGWSRFMIFLFLLWGGVVMNGGRI